MTFFILSLKIYIISTIANFIIAKLSYSVDYFDKFNKIIHIKNKKARLSLTFTQRFTAMHLTSPVTLYYNDTTHTKQYHNMLKSVADNKMYSGRKTNTSTRLSEQKIS